MNFVNYQKWLTTKLIPNLPQNSVLVIDNAPYHNVELNPAPNSSCRKADMMDWLTLHAIPFHSKMLKPELYSLIKLRKPAFKTFKIDALLSQHGHSVLRLPPYHPDLSPIELIWKSLKDYVEKKNAHFTLDSAMQLVEEKCQSMTPEDWISRCRHVQDTEETYIAQEPAIDAVTEQLVIQVGDDSDADDDGGDDYDDDDANTMSGIEAL